MSSTPSDKELTFQRLSDAPYIDLETYRRNGQGVRSPVFVAGFDGLLYISTTTKTGKFKRLRANPRVRLALSDFQGHPKGEWVEGETRLVEDQAIINRVNSILDKKHPFIRRLRSLQESFSNAKRVVYSIKLDDSKSVNNNSRST